jgi:subtilisin family serine protease
MCVNRRQALKTGGTALGALILGPSIATADQTQRFVVDSKRLRNREDVQIIHDLNPVNLLVVRATEEQLADSRAEFAPDIRTTPDPYRPVRQSSVEYPEGDEGLFEYQWDKHSQGIQEAHNVTRGEGTRVAIIDSGIASGHPDLEGQVNLELSKSFASDEYGVGEPYSGYHGTHVAGIVAASDTTEAGVIGSAPGTELVDLRVFAANPASTNRADLPPDYWGDTYYGSVLAALVYAAEIGCDAANLSLGWTWNMRDEGWGRFWGKVHQRVGNYARRNSTVHTHASGNWGESLQFNQDETDSSETAGGITTSGSCLKAV